MRKLINNLLRTFLIKVLECYKNFLEGIVEKFWYLKDFSSREMISRNFKKIFWVDYENGLKTFFQMWQMFIKNKN